MQRRWQAPLKFYTNLFPQKVYQFVIVPMERRRPIAEILEETRSILDTPAFSSFVRHAFDKTVKCGTGALGSEVYASDHEQKLVHHTCKTRACASCGHRRTMDWQREQRASLPDIPFAGVVFTMPDVSWPIFQRNRHLLNDLPAIGAVVLQRWAQEEHATKLMVMVVLHTFGRHLTFNPDLHILISSGGIREFDANWVRSLGFKDATLMMKWRYAALTYLRDVQKLGALQSELTPSELKTIFATQYGRRRRIHISRWFPKNTS